ncbi:MAG: ADOP family duplicated permease [Gemmatimonadaceae bacterium]
MLRRLLRVFRARTLERDMEEEMRFHVEMEAADLAARGMDAAEAHRVALVGFGGVTRFKEEGLEARGARWLAEAGQDVRYAVRTLRRNPAFAVVAVLTAALGIGATTAVFSAVDGVLLKPLPFPNPEQLVTVWSANLRQGDEPFTSSPPDFRELASAETGIVRSLAAFYPTAFTLSVRDGEPARVSGARVSPILFATLGVPPQLGRAFLPSEGEHGAHRVLLISAGLWARDFERDPAVVGKTVTLDREPFTIVGVMPADFRFPERRTDAWVPLAFAPGNSLNTRGNYFLQIVGRLTAGATVAQAQDALHRVAARVAAEHPEGNMTSVRVIPLRDQLIGAGVRSALLAFLGAIALVLLIACVNVASLLLARAAARQRELAVRTGLGASRARLVRQLLTESLLIGALGGVAGVLLAVGGVALLRIAGPADLPRLDEIGVDVRALTFTALLATATAVAFGLAPSLQASRAGATAALRHGHRASPGGSRRRAREVLVAVQMALAVILLVGAGLLIRSFAQVARVDPGFRVESVLTMNIPLPRSEYSDGARMWAFLDRVLERVRALPGVRSAAATTALSLGGGYWGKLISFADRAPATSLDQVPHVGYRVVTRDYFATMGVAVRAGRVFDESDRAGSPGVAVVNETAARKFWTGRSPIGTTIWMGAPEALIAGRGPATFRFPRLRVVGVVADERFTGLDQPPIVEVYQLSAQVTERGSEKYLVVRSDADPLALAAAVRREVRALDPYQPVAEVATMSQLVHVALAERRFGTALLGAFAALALTLAAVGLYGVVSYSVAQRRPELGVRMALGASSRRVLALVLRQGLRPALAGAVAGLAGALVLTRLMTNMLFGVAPTDPLTMLAVACVLIAVAAVASLLPARRAARVHPAEALRSDG